MGIPLTLYEILICSQCQKRQMVYVGHDAPVDAHKACHYCDTAWKAQGIQVPGVEQFEEALEALLNWCVKILCAFVVVPGLVITLLFSRFPATLFRGLTVGDGKLAFLWVGLGLTCFCGWLAMKIPQKRAGHFWITWHRSPMSTPPA